MHSDAIGRAQVVETRRRRVCASRVVDHDTVDGVDEALAAGTPRISSRPRTETPRSTAPPRTPVWAGIGHRSSLWPKPIDAARTASAAPMRCRALGELGFEIAPAPIEARRLGQARGRPHLAAAVLPPGQRRSTRRGGPRRCLLLHTGLPDPGHARIRRAHAPHGRGGDRVDPRRRRRGGLGPSVLGHQGRRRGAGGHRALPGGRPRRRGGLLHRPPREHPFCGRPLRGPDCSHRSPTTTPGPRSASPGLDNSREAKSGRRHGTLAAPARGGRRALLPDGADRESQR